MRPILKKLRVLIVLMCAAVFCTAYLFVEELSTPHYFANPAKAVIDTSPVASNTSKGEALFKQNCTACHTLDKKLTGPALAGIEDRMNYKLFEKLLLKPEKAYKQSPYLKALQKEYEDTQHMPFQGMLTKQEIEQIFLYLNTWKPVTLPYAIAG
jgi:cytochrome c2